MEGIMNINTYKMFGEKSVNFFLKSAESGGKKHFPENRKYIPLFVIPKQPYLKSVIPVRIKENENSKFLDLNKTSTILPRTVYVDTKKLNTTTTMLPRTLNACLKNLKKTSTILPWTLNAYTQKLTSNRRPIMVPLSSKDRNQFELKASSAMIKPNLVQHHAVSNKHDYNHFKNLKEKEVYRSNLLKKISETLSESKRINLFDW